MVDAWEIAAIAGGSACVAGGTIYKVVGCVRRRRALRQQRREEEERRREEERRQREREDFLARHTLGKPGWRERSLRSTAPAAAPRPTAPPPRSAASSLEDSEITPVPPAPRPTAPPPRSAASSSEDSEITPVPPAPRPTAPPPRSAASSSEDSEITPVRLRIRTISWAAGLENIDDEPFFTARNFMPLPDEAQIV